MYIHTYCVCVCMCVHTRVYDDDVHLPDDTHVSCMLVSRCLRVSASVLACIDWRQQQVDVSDRLNYSNQSLLTPHLSATHTSLLSSSVSSPLPTLPSISVTPFYPFLPLLSLQCAVSLLTSVFISLCLNFFFYRCLVLLLSSFLYLPL